MRRLFVLIAASCGLLPAIACWFLVLSLKTASEPLFSIARIDSWTSSGCVRCLICRVLRELLLYSNNKLSSFATFLSWMEIWVAKFATEIVSRFRSSWVAFWVSCNVFYVESTQIKCKKLTSLQHRCLQFVVSTRPSKMIFAVLDVWIGRSYTVL